MDYIKCPRELLDESLPFMDQHHLDPVHFRQLGVAIVRNAIPAAVVNTWVDAWQAFRADTLREDRRIDPFNPVVVHEPVEGVLAGMHREPVLLDILQTLYPDLALYMRRFLFKNAAHPQPVFLHQDYSYDTGWPDKTAVFLPLAPMGPDNGGLILYPGTHWLGYLGDAGELDRNVLDPTWPSVAPVIAPGDIVLMHDCTWHESSPWTRGPERVLLQATYQSADDPSGTELLRGRSRFGLGLGAIDAGRLFKRSRSSRLREMQSALNNLSAPPAENRS